MEEWSWKVGGLSVYQICVHYALFFIFIYFLGGQHNPFQDKSTSCLPQVQSHWCLTIHNDSLLYFVSQSTTCSCTKLMKSKQLWNYVMIWHHSVRSREYVVKGHFWGMCDLQSSLCTRSEVGIWCERCNWRSHMPRNWLLTSSILIVTSQHEVTSGVARWGQGGNCPLAETLPPLAPPMKSHIVQRSMVSCILSPSQPPLTQAPLAAPSFWSLAMPLDVTRSHLIISKLFWFSLTWRNCIFAWLTKIVIWVIFDRRTSVNLQVVEDKMLIYLDKRKSQPNTVLTFRVFFWTVYFILTHPCTNIFIYLVVCLRACCS